MNIDIRLFSYKIVDLDTVEEFYSGHTWFIENVKVHSGELKWVIRQLESYLCIDHSFGHSLSPDIFQSNSFEEALDFLKDYIETGKK